MQHTSAPALSPSERLTLQYVAEGEWHPSELDCVALQRLKTMGLVEEQSRAVIVTKAGRRALGMVA